MRLDSTTTAAPYADKPPPMRRESLGGHMRHEAIPLTPRSRAAADAEFERDYVPPHLLDRELRVDPRAEQLSENIESLFSSLLAPAPAAAVAQIVREKLGATIAPVQGHADANRLLRDCIEAALMSRPTPEVTALAVLFQRLRYNLGLFRWRETVAVFHQSVQQTHAARTQVGVGG